MFPFLWPMDSGDVTLDCLQPKLGRFKLKQQFLPKINDFLFYLQDKILPRSGYRLTTNPDKEPNYVSLLMADGLQRRNVGSSAAQIGPVHDKTTIPTQNVVNYAPTRENQLKLHTLNNVGQAMVIRLALDSTSQTGTKAHTYIIS